MLVRSDRVRLPVPFSFSRFPQIILFPAASAGESKIFGEKISLRNLLGWLLQNIDEETRIYSALELKGKAQIRLKVQT